MLKFCRKQTQNVDLQDPAGPAIIQVNGCVNLTSALIALIELTLLPSNQLNYSRTVRTIIVSQTPLQKGYSIDLILRVCHYGYARTVAPISFDIFIRANRDGAV